MVFTFLKAQGHEVGKSLLEEDQLDTCRSYLERARGVRRRDPAADRRRRRHGVPLGRPRARAPRRTRRRDPGRQPRPRHRPRLRPGVRRRAGRRADGLLERPDGRVRDAAFAEGTRAVAEALTKVARPLRRRRRRLGGRRAPARLRRGRLRSHLDRWRRQPGVPGGQGAPRDRRPRAIGPPRNAGTMSRTPLMAGNWKMNLTHQEAVVLVQKLSWTLNDKKHDYGKAEVVVLPPFTDIRSVQTLVDGDQLVDRLRRPGRLRARVRRLHRRDLRGDAGQAGLQLRVRRALRAAGVPRRSPTSWSTPRPRPPSARA